MWILTLQWGYNITSFLSWLDKPEFQVNASCRTWRAADITHLKAAKTATFWPLDFENVNKVFRRLKSSNLALDFQSYRAVLLDLEQRFEVARSSFTARIQILIPKIRSKKANATELTDLLQDYNDSPYEREKLIGLLSTRQKEIETAEFIVYNEKLSNIQNKYIDLGKKFLLFKKELQRSQK